MKCNNSYINNFSPVKSALIIFICIFCISPIFAERNMNILVLPFENQGVKTYSWLSAGMTDSVIGDLGKIRSVSVVSDEDRKKIETELAYQRNMGRSSEEIRAMIAKSAAADVIFTGSYVVIGKQVQVVAKLIDVRSNKTTNSTKLRGTIDDIFDLQDKIVFSLLDESKKISLSDVKKLDVQENEKKEMAVRPTQKNLAYEFYSRGLELEEIHPDEALSYYNKAIKEDPGYVEAMLAAGYLSGNILNHFNDALTSLNKADSVLKKNGKSQTELYANLMIHTGIVYWKKGDLDVALGYYKKSRVIMEKLGLQNTAGYAVLVINIGIIYWDKGELDRALIEYNHSKEIQERLGQQVSTTYATLMMNTGIVYWNKGDLDHALDYYNRSKEIHDSLGLQNTSTYATLMMNTGIVYWNKKNFDQSLVYYNLSREIQERLGLQKTSDYANLLMNTGIVYWEKGNSDRAFEYYNRSGEIYEKLGLQNTSEYASLMLNTGIIFWEKKNYKLSLDYYNRSKKIQDHLNLQNTSDYATLMYNIAIIYENEKDYVSAGRYYRTAHQIYVKVYGKDHESSKDADVRAKYFGQ